MHAVNGITFDLGEGESMAIVGESGSGKSVAMKSMMGIIPSPPGKVEAGTVIFGDRDLLQLSAAEMRRVRGRAMARRVQEPRPSGKPGPRGGGAGRGGGVSGGASAGMAIHKSEGLVPINDQCESNVPGLFAAGDALGSYMCGAIYTQVGSSLAGSAVQGAVAGEAAARYSQGVELQAQLRPEQHVLADLLQQRLADLLERG